MIEKLYRAMRIEDNLAIELCKTSKDPDKIKELIHSKGFSLLRFFSLLEKNMVFAVALSELLKHNYPQYLKDKIVKYTRYTVLGDTIHNQMILGEIRNIVSILNKKSIEVILMKGVTLDRIGIRTIGDIDILVKKNDLLEAIESLKEADYYYVAHKMNYNLSRKEKKDISLQMDWNSQYQLKNEKKGQLLELHINLFERTRVYSINLDSLLDNIKLFWDRKVWNESFGVFCFRPEDQLLQMCMHNAIKRSPAKNRFALRNMLDIEGLILSSNIDWNSFTQSSISLGVAPFILFSLTLVKAIMGTSIPDECIQELQNNSTKHELFLNRIHMKCLKSLRSSSLLYSKIYQVISPLVYGKGFLSIVKTVLFVSVIFPPRWKMAGRYHISMNNPLIVFTYLLNPFRWIYLIIMSLFNK